MEPVSECLLCMKIRWHQAQISQTEKVQEYRWVQSLEGEKGKIHGWCTSAQWEASFKF